VPPDADSTLLVDLDGTVAAQLPRACEYLADEYGVHVRPAEIDAWSWPVPGHDAHIGEVVVELMEERPRWFLGGLEPYPGARAGLEALSAAGYDLHVATHRLPATHDISVEWLDAHDIPYDRFIRDVPADKGALAGAALLDDYHGNVADALAAGKAGVLVRRPYSDPAACEGAHVVDDWGELTALFGV
jgi:phosphoglycolate phosphatase-like HAD superfamily hydrolase